MIAGWPPATWPINNVLNSQDERGIDFSPGCFRRNGDCEGLTTVDHLTSAEASIPYWLRLRRVLSAGAYREVSGRYFFFALQSWKNSRVFGCSCDQEPIRIRSGTGQDWIRTRSGVAQTRLRKPRLRVFCASSRSFPPLQRTGAAIVYFTFCSLHFSVPDLSFANSIFDFRYRATILYLYCSYHQLTTASIYTTILALCEKTRILSGGAENRS